MSVTLNLFRQDPARAALVRAVLTCLAVGFLFRMVPDISAGLARAQSDDLPGGFVYMYLLLTGLIVTMVLGGNSWTRSSRLSLGLPLSARRVWAVRIISLIAIAVISTAALAVSTAITVDPNQGTVAFNSVILLTAARAAVTSVLVLLIFQLPLSAQSSIPISAAYVVYLIFTGVIILVFSSAALTSLVGTAVLFVIAILLGVWLAIRVPPSFSIGPSVEESLSPVCITSEEGEPVEQDGWATQIHGPSRKILHKVLFRGLKPNLLIWFLLAIIGASVAVVTLEFLEGTNAFVPLFFIVIYHLPILQGTLESMTPYDSLPISRRTLWAHTVMPIAVSAALGLVIAISIFMVNPEPFTQIQFNRCCTQVPWDYWGISPGGDVPAVTTSWGESYTPRAHHLWRGRSVALYNPFETGPESSSRFVEYQMRRAAHAVYDIPVPHVLSDPGYEPPENIVGGVERGAFTLDVTRGRLSEDRGRTAAVALTALAVLIFGLMLPSLLQYGSSVHRKIFKRASIAFIAVFVAAVVAASIARLLGFTEVWYIGVLISMTFRSLAHALPLPTPFMWLVCVTFWIGSCLLLGRVFATIEFPREKTMNRFAEEY